MMKFSLIAAAFVAAQYQYPSTQPSGSSGNETDSSQQEGFDTAPFAQVYRKCFQSAEAETQATAADVKQQKFDACRGQRNDIIEHVTAKLDGSEARRVKRALHRALGDVEKSYAKRMGVVLPPSDK
jgi:hypothetical protein